MKARILIIVGIVFTAAATVNAQPGITMPYANERQPAMDVYERYVAGRLTIEPQIRLFVLRHKQRPADTARQETFVGYINELNEVNELALRLSFGYQVNTFLSAHIGYEDVAARTMNFNNKLSDGNVRMSGPIISARIGYPLYDRFFPYVGLGYERKFRT